MTLSALQRQLGIRESDEPDADQPEVQIARTEPVGDATPIVEDGVISDARRHAWRRRTGYAVIVAAAASAIVGGAFAVFGGSADDPTGGAGPEQPGALAAPVRPEADVVGIWAELHRGWVYVYDDGRVLSYPDAGPITERRLSPYGVDLVRDGELDPQQLLRPQLARLPAGVWSNSAPQPYLPSQYAICNLRLVPAPDPDVLSDVGLIEARLPEQVRVTLRAGQMQSFTDDFVDENGDFVGPDGYHSEPGSGVDCLVSGVRETQAFWVHTRAQSGSEGASSQFRRSDTTFGALNGTDGSEIVVLAIPIMPHGGWVLWGG